MLKATVLDHLLAYLHHSIYFKTSQWLNASKYKGCWSVKCYTIREDYKVMEHRHGIFKLLKDIYLFCNLVKIHLGLKGMTAPGLAWDHSLGAAVTGCGKVLNCRSLRKLMISFVGV